MNIDDALFSPPFLNAGDTIGIVAPARKISPNELTASVEWFVKQGLQVKFGTHLFNQLYQYSGTDEQRASDVMDMFSDTAVKAIVCARGGYGSVRLIEFLDPKVIVSNPKWVLGYSDVTVLHSYINQVCKMQTIHTTMPINFPKDLISEANETWNRMLSCVAGTTIPTCVAIHPLNRTGAATGMLIGGNLSVLYSLRGTFLDINTDGKILFLEDLDEYLYHIDRMMMNLKLGGKLKRLKGLIIGGMNDMKDNTIPFGKSAYEIIQDAVAEYDYPVAFNFPAGHLNQNFPLKFGSVAQLDVCSISVSLKQ